MKKKLVTLYIDDASLRLTVVRRGQVKKSASLALEPGTLNGLVAADEEKFANDVAGFLRTQKVRGKKVSLAVSGVNSLTRQIVLPSLPRNLLDEAIVHEARRIFPVPIEQLHLSWQTVPAPEGKIQVFVVALMRPAIDSLFGALKMAGVKVTSLTIKPLVLSRLVSGNALLVDVQVADMDVVVLANGTPQPVRNVSFPAEATSWQARFPIVMDEIERTLQFYQANNPDKPLPPDLPFYVSGEMAKRNKYWPRIKEHFGFNVQALNSPLPTPEGVDPQDYMVNLALTMVEPPGLTAPPANAINLLPAPYRVQPIKWQRALTIPAAVTLVGMVILLIMLISGTSANISATRMQVEATSKVLQERQLQKQEMKKTQKDLEGSLAAARQVRDDAAKVLNTLEGHATTINEDLRAIVDRVTNGVALSSIGMTDANLTIEGKCPTEDGILAFARSIDESGRFAQTVVAEISKNDDSVSFTLHLLK